MQLKYHPFNHLNFKTMCKKTAVFLSIFLLANTLFAAGGAIKGKVVSAESAEELIGATVFIKGTTIGAVVDFEGNYHIKNVPTGKQTLICSYISFNSDSVEVTITDNQVVTYNFTLQNSSVALSDFVVEAKAVKSSENYMLKVKQKSATVMEGITAQEITKRGDNDVASAAKRVTGVTIEGGKYVYVRGLSDRYSKTTLNGAEIPGLDPNKNDGGRDIPDAVLNGGVPPLFVNNPQLEKVSKSFSKEMEGVTSPSSLNQRYSLSVGNQKTVFGNTLGFVAGISYSRAFVHQQQNAFSGRYSLTGSVDEVEELITQQELNDTKSQEEVLLGALGNLSYKVGRNNKFSFTYVRNQSGTKETTFQEGIFPKEDEGLFYQTRGLSYQERQLTSYQLIGDHYIESLKKLKIDWLTSFSSSSQYTPDQRYFSNDYRVNSDNDTTYSINASAYPAPARFYRYLDQSTFDAKLNLELVAFEKDGQSSKIKFGGAYLFQDRTLAEFRYNYRKQGANLFDGSVSDYLADENMVLPSPGNPVSQYIYIEDASEKRNNYVGEQIITAGYLMGDIWATKKLRVIGGARLETTYITSVSDDETQKAGLLEGVDIFPAINTSYALSPKANLRAAYSKTLARPTFREISGFASYDFAANWIIIGNPDLDRTLIDNIDLRFELFPNLGELISFGVFYKNFSNPIEFVFNTQAQNDELTWRNVANGKLYGAEIEVKKQLNFISNDKHQYSVGGNFSLIQSEVDIDQQQLELIRAQDPSAASTREMYGQSPYIVNAFVGYNNDTLGLSINVNYNVAGEKITLVVVDATPNVKAQPVHQLNMNLTKTLGDHFKLKLSASNLFNPIVKQTQVYKGKEYLFNSYQLGRTYGISLSYLF